MTNLSSISHVNNFNFVKNKAFIIEEHILDTNVGKQLSQAATDV